MNTPSHLIINAALRKRAGPARLRGSAFLLGAVLPDLPLWLLWMGLYCYERYLLGDLAINAMDKQFDTLYFTNPLWIASYNTLHAPLLLLPALALLWRFRSQLTARGGWWFWFVAGCLVHTAIDIPTHSNDGPLLFFPLEWTIRFHSPISYWDPRHYGRQFTIFEFGLDLVLLVYLGVPWVIQRLRARSVLPSERHP